MTQASEIAGHVSTATGLCLNLSDFAPGLVVLQLILFLISAGISVFDTYSDWVVVLDYKEVGFNNPLLPFSNHWLRAWFLFTVIGTVLTVLSVSHDGLVLLYSMYQSCKRHCCKCGSKGNAKKRYEIELNEKQISDINNLKEEEEEVVEDPCKPCYHCGCNVATRSETLGAISIWFQDVPMLTLGVLYAFTQTTCKTPDVRDVSPVLRDISISATAACLSTLWTTVRSFVRLYSSVGVRIDPKEGCVKRCLPKKGNSVYPPKSRAQFCIFGFYLGLLFQIQALAMAFIVTGILWLQFILAQSNPNFDESLGIYRFSVNYPDSRLFNVSAIIPPNVTSGEDGVFVNLEQIPPLEAFTVYLDEEIFCLSEFNYQSKQSEIFFNTIEIVPVSDDGRFCTSRSGRDHQENQCVLFYIFQNFVLYYGFTERDTGQIINFRDQCSIFSTSFDFSDGYGPEADLSIDVARHINRTGFPENDNAPLVIIFPPSANITYSRVNASGSNVEVAVYTDPSDGSTFACVTEFAISDGQVVYNYRDVYVCNSNADCVCSPIGSPGPLCAQYHENLSYGYLDGNGEVVPYTHCAGIPQEKLVPNYQSTLNTLSRVICTL